MLVAEALPLIKVPAHWPIPVVATVAMVALAALDLTGSVAAKEWAEHGNLRALVLGALSFLVLWWVYASSLRYAELSIVTMGWIVILQVGILVVDRVRYGVELPTGKWVAIGVVLLAQGYLILGPNVSIGGDEATPHAATPAQSAPQASTLTPAGRAAAASDWSKVASLRPSRSARSR